MVSGDGAEPPNPLLVHGALIATQVLFGGGAVVGKFGVHGTNPILFAFVRDSVAGPILYAASLLYTKERCPRCRDGPRLVAAAMGLFLGQVLMLAGLKLTDPVTASAWQPSQPVFTAALAIAVGYERASARKALGILTSVAGAIFMVTCGSQARAASTSSTTSQAGLLGHVFFFLNCFGTSVYVVASKELLRRYPPICVTAWSYLVACVAMLTTVVTVNESPSLLKFFCTDANPSVQQACVAGAWSVPRSMLLPLAYWILFQSVLAYALMTWGNRYAAASVVSVYTVLQPLTSGSISAALVFLRGRAWADAYGMEAPGVQDLGVLAIALGLWLIFAERAPAVALGGSARDADCGGACEEGAALGACRIPPTCLEQEGEEEE